MVSLPMPPYNTEDPANAFPLSVEQRYQQQRITPTLHDHFLALYAQEVITESSILDEHTADQLELMIEEDEALAARLDFFMDELATDGLEWWKHPSYVPPAFALRLAVAVAEYEQNDLPIEPEQPVRVRSVSNFAYNFGLTNQE